MPIQIGINGEREITPCIPLQSHRNWISETEKDSICKTIIQKPVWSPYKSLIDKSVVFVAILIHWGSTIRIARQFIREAVWQNQNLPFWATLTLKNVANIHWSCTSSTWWKIDILF